MVIYKRDRHVELGTIENKSSLCTDLPPLPSGDKRFFLRVRWGGGGSVYRLEQIQQAVRAGLELGASEFKRTNLSATVLPSLLFKENTCASVHS